MSVVLSGGVRHPKIYAYQLDRFKEQPWTGTRKGKGLIKVGYTDRDVSVRIREQLNGVKMPLDTPYELLLSEPALTASGRAFRDHDIHKALVAAGVTRKEGEWFECNLEELQATIHSIQSEQSLSPGYNNLRQKFSFRPREEQIEAVNVTASYFEQNASKANPPHFLWNAKMRFGKTFAAYQLAKKMGWSRILVLTYKPAVETAWREDLLGHEDFEGWLFRGKEDPMPDFDNVNPLVWFSSFQDVLGTDEKGNPKSKNLGIYSVDWDVIIIDEYHFGAWRDAARSLYLGDSDSLTHGDLSEKAELETPDLEDGFAVNLEANLRLKVSNYLYLSGTPFRALTQGEFLENQIFNWTYSDEQSAKTLWPKTETNPYAALPQMVLLTYEMPEELKEIALNNFSEFSLSEFFKTQRGSDNRPHFIHERDVQRWLDLLRGQNIQGLWASVSNTHRPPLPFEDLNLLKALQHTVWYLPGVDSCLAMHDLLSAQHNTFFHDYTIVIAAGSKAGMGAKALPPVTKAIGQIPQITKSITLSCGKLMTGVTVPPWAGIFMLRELASPESYFQAAFRVQSPWSNRLINTEVGGLDEIVIKEQCYVLDFSPNRALRQIVDYATRLQSAVASESSDEEAIESFMEFMPIISFDGYSMSQLRASDVIDFLTKGVSSSMLARRFNSSELITLNLSSMEALLSNPALMESLEKIEMFRNISNDLTMMISTNKELSQKKLAKEKLEKHEERRAEDAKKHRENLKMKLQRLITRIPAFMYLTDEREKTVRDIIEQLEPQLFEKVTGITLTDFAQLVDAGVFHDSKMNDVVWKFRSFEEPSLSYGYVNKDLQALGGWTIRRDQDMARIIERGSLIPGTVIWVDTVGRSMEGVITEDFGISVGGIRFESPDEAIFAATDGRVSNGWKNWKVSIQDGFKTLEDLK